MILLKNIVKRRLGEEIISNITLELEGNGVFGLIDPSEESKKSIVNILSGADNSFEGEIVLNDNSYSAKEGEAAFLRLKRKIGYLPASPVFYGDTTVKEILDFVGEAKGIEVDSRYRQIKEALELTGCDRVRELLCSKLTPSQKRRVAFAAALLGNPQMIIIDEPYVNFDARERDEIKAIIDMIGKIKPVIIVTKSEDVAEALCQRIFMLSEGKVSFEGDVDELLQNTNSTKLFNVRLVSKEERESDELVALLEEQSEILACEVISVTDAGEMSVRLETQLVPSIDTIIKKLLAENGYIVLSLDSAKRGVALTEKAEV